MAKNLLKAIRRAFLVSSALVGFACTSPAAYAPTPIYSASQKDDKPEILVNLDGQANGNSIAKYRAGIDANSNGVLEDNEVNLTGDSPIVNGIIESGYGKFDTIGECVDSAGNIGRSLASVIIKQPPKPVFSGNLNVSASEGNCPLEDLVSLTGDGFTKYEIGADLDGDEKLGASEIFASSSSAIKNKKIIFTSPGIYNVYGQVTNTGGELGISGPVKVIISSEIANTDLTETMALSSYKAGGKFTYTGKIQNTTSPYSPLTLDNSNKNSIEYKIIREIISGIGEQTFDEKLADPMVIVLKENGYLQLEQKDNDILYATMANVDITYNGIGPIPFFDSPLVWPIDPHLCNIIKKSGAYLVETIINYQKNGNPLAYGFMSDTFNVTE